MAKKSSATSSLEKMLVKFNEEMGEGLVHTASDIPNCTRVKSSVPAYNYATCGGFPIGRVIEHFGEQGALKSYVAYDAIAQFQRYDWANHLQGVFTKFVYEGKGIAKELKSFETKAVTRGVKNPPEARRVALVDIEGTYTPDWGENFGIDNEGLIVIRPSLLSESVDIVQALLEDENICLIVFDSLSAIGTDEELDKSMEDHQMAAGAKFWNKAFRKFQSAINNNPHKEATLLVINSAYQKVGIAYGDPEVIRNGEQLRRTKTISVKFKALKEISAKTDEGEEMIGRNIAIKCVKNKVGIPGRMANFFYAYRTHGFTQAFKTDVEGQLVDLAIRFGVVKRRGAYYSFGDFQVQGMDAFIIALIEKKMLRAVEKEIDKHLMEE